MYFFKHTGHDTFVRLIISLVKIQSATPAMLQKELIIQNTKLLLWMTISNLTKTSTNRVSQEIKTPPVLITGELRLPSEN